MAGAIRSYCKSEFDHVAIVIRYAHEPNEVYFIEAVGVHGVQMKTFSEMKHEIGDFIKTMALRKLEFPRSDQALENMNKFVDEVMGAEYQIRVSSLLK